MIFVYWTDGNYCGEIAAPNPEAVAKKLAEAGQECPKALVMMPSEDWNALTQAQREQLDAEIKAGIHDPEPETSDPFAETILGLLSLIREMAKEAKGRMPKTAPGEPATVYDGIHAGGAIEAIARKHEPRQRVRVILG